MKGKKRRRERRELSQSDLSSSYSCQYLYHNSWIVKNLHKLWALMIVSLAACGITSTVQGHHTLGLDVLNLCCLS